MDDLSAYECGKSFFLQSESVKQPNFSFCNILFPLSCFL